MSDTKSGTTKKYILIFSSFIIFGLIFLLTDNILAAESVKYTAQVGFGEFKTGVPMDIDGNSIGRYINSIYKYAIGVVGILAAIVMMWGGVRWTMAGGDKDAIGDAKKWIGGAASGLILAMTTYMILNFVNPDLVNFKSIDIEKIRATQTTGWITSYKSSPQANCPTIGTANKLQIYYSPAEVARLNITQCADTTQGCCETQDYVAPIAAAGTGVAAKDSGQADSSVVTGLEDRYSFQKGISMAGAGPEIKNVLLKLSEKSGLPASKLIVTSVAGGVHNNGDFSHANGYKADLSRTPELTSYIKNSDDFTPMGKRSDGYNIYQNNLTGACFADEKDKNHWDITSQNCK